MYCKCISVLKLENRSFTKNLVKSEEKAKRMNIVRLFRKTVCKSLE